MHPKLCRTEWLAFGFTLVVAAACFAHLWWYPSNLFDAAQYAEMGRNIAEHGPFSRFMESQVRTYGYPAFLSLVYLAADTARLPSALLLFLAQFGLYVVAALVLRRSIGWQSRSAARVVFSGLMLNYYAVLYTPECLTESVSLSATVLLGAGWLEASRRPGSIGVLGLASLIAGGAVLIRPANVAAAGVWVAGAALIAVRNRFSIARAVLVAAVITAGMALPFLPQFAYNGLQFGHWTPLLARDLGQRQQAWGIEDIKYATAVPPVPGASVHYLNPWLGGTSFDVDAPLAWYAAHPARGALTLAAHSFNLTDQDLLFTYSRDLDPWYRIPLGIINHSVVVLGVIGLLLAIVRARHAESRTSVDALGLVTLMILAVWAVHVWTAVEMRFGLALLCVLFPAALYTLRALAQARSRRAIAMTLAVVALYVAGALRLSTWVREQSPLIRAAVAERHR